MHPGFLPSPHKYKWGESSEGQSWPNWGLVSPVENTARKLLRGGFALYWGDLLHPC